MFLFCFLALARLARFGGPRFQKHRHMGDGGIVGSHALRGFGLDSDRIRGQPGQLGYARAMAAVCGPIWGGENQEWNRD